MKTVPQFLFAFVFLTILSFACKKESPPNPPNPPSPPDPPEYTGSIRFDSMEIGQRSRYLALLGEYYSSILDSFAYTTDTLQLQIVAQDANGYLIEESFRYVGAVSNWFNHEKDSIFRYYVTVVDDTLRFKQVGASYLRSRIFGYYTARDGLPLADISSPKIDIVGWKTNLGYCECRRTGYTEDYSLFGKTYPRLNVALDNEPMSFDGNGETYVYSKTVGIVRYSTYSWWTAGGYGWDLLADE